MPAMSKMASKGSRAALCSAAALAAGSGAAMQTSFATAPAPLVADMTDPDWEPIMKKAGAIVTNRGGRTCHAAIIARELGIPAVVGTSNATDVLKDGSDVTVCCAEGDTGMIYNGQLEYERTEQDVGEVPKVGMKIMMNVGNPESAFTFGQLPSDGIGLARLEFVINNSIGLYAVPRDGRHQVDYMDSLDRG